MTTDVLVVGGGIEGYTAALSALASDETETVRLLRRRDDRFETETGLISLLGYDEGEPVANPIDAFENLPERHQYRRQDLKTVQSALELFDDVTGEQYAGADSADNALFPTAVGKLAPAIRSPKSMAAGIASYDQPIRLIGFERLPDFDAELAASRLDEGTPYEVTGTTVETEFDIEESPAVEIAEQLDANEPTDGRSARESLAATIEPELDVEPRIGLPAVLGETKTTAIVETLNEQLHANVFEVPLGPPSLPGQRLEALLRDAVEARGGTVTTGVDITAVDAGDGRIDSIEFAQDGDPTVIEADSYVLATGGLSDGGLDGGPGGVTEPVFGAAVSQSDGNLLDREFLGDHAAVRVGVETDEALRPLDTDDTVLYENLRAAGSVLDSTNRLADHTASGFALLTGYVAGERGISSR